MNNYQTPLADVTILENGIQKEVWRIKELTNLEMAQEHMTKLEENIREDLIVLVDVTNVKKISKPVRDFLGTFSVKPYPVAIALLVGSGLSKVVGTLFLRFNRPKDYPMKLFTDEKNATTWLLTTLANKA